MHLREKQHMNSDTESATHTGMEGQQRGCHNKYLLLQVWCGLLTVAMVVMAAFLTSIKPKSAQYEVPTPKPVPVSSTVSTGPAPFKSGSAFSYIQLSWSRSNLSWQHSVPACPSCALKLQDNSVHCKETSLYFFYAQVDFNNRLKKNQTNSVILKKNASYGISMRKLVDATFPNTAMGPVWVAKVVRLRDRDKVSIQIEGDFQTEGTYWGVFQLR